MPRRSRWFVAAGIVALLASAYGFFSALQAAMLFEGLRALRNFNLWASLWLVALMGALVCFARASQPYYQPSRPARILAGLLSVAGAAWAFAAIVGEALAVDACLDLGRSFNYIVSECSLEGSEPYVPFLQRRGFQLVASVLLVASSISAFMGGRRTGTEAVAL